MLVASLAMHLPPNGGMMNGKELALAAILLRLCDTIWLFHCNTWTY
jgi:hypothetical protein